MKRINEVLSKKDLVDYFLRLGLKSGMIVEVHSSIKALGTILGGAATVLDALIEVVGYNGTIIMPMHNYANTEPSKWQYPPVALSLIAKVRSEVPAFDRKMSDAYKMGALVEALRRKEGVVISSHPSVAYAAWGKYAKLLCNHQSFHFALSEESATATLYAMKAHCLLLGVDYDSATCMHLAEYRSDIRPIIVEGCAINVDGKRQWKKRLDVDLDSDDFLGVFKVIEAKGYVTKQAIGTSAMKLFRIDVAIDEAIKYFDNHHIYNLYR